jgi:hypothetical protein
MAITVVPSNTSVSVIDGNNLTVELQPAAQVAIGVVSTPTQTINISRGVSGPAGPNSIGGYPINVNNPAYRDVVMFGVNEWVNTPQTEIADGGSF